MIYYARAEKKRKKNRQTKKEKGKRKKQMCPIRLYKYRSLISFNNRFLYLSYRNNRYERRRGLTEVNFI